MIKLYPSKFHFVLVTIEDGIIVKCPSSMSMRKKRLLRKIVAPKKISGCAVVLDKEFAKKTSGGIACSCCSESTISDPAPGPAIITRQS